MVTWQQRQFVGMPEMTRTMMDILCRLAAARDEQGYQLIPLPGLRGNTRKALPQRDWMFESTLVFAEPRYQITGRGVEALKLYSLPLEPRRHDDICPTCELRPVAYSASGKRGGYCKECRAELDKRKQQRRHGGRRPHQLCPVCGERERQVFPGGKIASYCAECRQARRAADRQLKYERQLARIAAGEFIPCSTCGIRPVHYGDTYVYDRCHECFCEYMNAYNRRRRGKA
jgi:hypothetical protein